MQQTSACVGKLNVADINVDRRSHSIGYVESIWRTPTPVLYSHPLASPNCFLPIAICGCYDGKNTINTNDAIDINCGVQPLENAANPRYL